MNNYLKLKRKKIIEVAFTIIVIFVGFFTSMKGIYGTEGDPEVLFNCALGAGGTTIECDVRLATGSESILSVNANYMALPTGLSYGSFTFDSTCNDNNNNCVAVATENGFAYGLVTGISNNTKIGTLTLNVDSNSQASSYTVGLTNIELSDDEYQMITLNNVTSTVNMMTDATCPTITPYEGTYDGNNHTITVGNDAVGGTVEYKVGTDGTWSTTNPTRKAVGTTTVYVRVAGDATHNTVDCGNSLVIISKKSLTASATVANKTYDGTTNATCTVNLTGVVSGDTVTATATGTFDNKNVGTGKTVTCSNITLAGTDKDNYSTSSSTSTTANITTRGVTIKAKNQTIAYGENIATGTGQVELTSGSLVSGDALNSVTLTPSTANVTTSGTITPSAAVIKDSNGSGSNMSSNYAVTYAVGTLTITAVDATCPTLTAYSNTYDGQNHTITVGNNATGGTVQYRTSTTGTWETTNPTRKDVGTTTVYVRVEGDANHNTKDCGSKTVNIDAISLTSTQISDYSTAWVEGATTYTREISVGTINETINITYTPYTNTVGEYTYSTTAASGKYTLTLSSNNYSVGSAGKLTLTGSSATCPTLTAYEGTYDGQNHTITVGNNASGGTVQYRTSTNGTWSTTNPTRKDVGTTTVYVRVEGDANHGTIDCGSKTLVVSKKSLTAGATASNKTYDGTTTATCNISLTGVVSGDTVTATATGTFNNKNVGTGKTVTCSNITLAGTSKDNYTVATSTSTTANITAREITIKAKNQTIAYGETITSGTGQIELSSGSLVDNETITNITLTPSTSNVTTSGTITPSAATIKDNGGSGTTVNSNYAISYLTGTLTITAVDATCPTLTAYNGTYDGQNHTIIVGNNAVGGTVEYRTSTTGSWETTNPTRKDVGTTTVYVRVAGDANHNTKDCENKTLSVTARAVTIKAKDQEISYGESIAEGTNQVTISNGSLVSGNTISNITLTPSTTSVTTNGTITPSAAAIKDGSNNNVTDNYTITYSNGTLIINGIDATCPTLTAYTGTYDGQNHTITVGDNAQGGTVQYRETTNGTWSTTLPTRKDAGTTNVYVRVSGDANHNTKDCGNTSITINQKALTSIRVDDYTTTWVSGTTSYSREISTGVGNETVTISYIPYKNEAGEYYYSYTAEDSMYTISLSNNNYKVTSAGTFTLTPIDAVCPSLASYNGVYDGQNHKITTGNNAVGGTVQYKASTASEWGTVEPTRKDVGTSTIYVRVSGDANHNTINCETQTISIIGKPLTIVAKSQTIAYGSSIAEGVNQIQITSGSLLSGDTITDVTLTQSTVNVTTNGKITPSAAKIKDGNDNDITNNYLINYVQGTLTITGVAATCPTVTGYEGTYDGEIHSITVGNNAIGGVVQYRTSPNGTWSETKPERKDVGTTTVYVQVLGDANHSSTDCGNSTIIVSKKTLVPIADASNKVYDGTTSAACTVNLTGIVGEDNVLPSYTGSFSDKNVGNNKPVTCYNITLTGTDSGNYSVASSASASANITIREVTIKARNQIIAYGENISSEANQVEISRGSLATGDAVSNVTLTPSTLDVTTTGTITPSAATIKDIDGTGSNMNGNYTISYADGSLIVATGVATCPTTITGYSGVYDGSNHTISVSNDASGGSLEYRTSAADAWSDVNPTRKDVGTTTVYIRVSGDINHAPVNCGDETITITAKELTSSVISAYSTTWVRGSSSYTREISTGVESETVRLTYTPFENETGEYEYSEEPAAEKFTLSQTNTNYSITSAGNFTLTAVDATCPTMTAYDGIYDGEHHTISVGNDAIGGVVQYRTSTNGTWSTTNPARKDIGTTTVYVRVSGDDNHNTKDCGSRTLRITAREITIKAKDQMIAYGESIQEGVNQIQVTSGALATGDVISGITLTPSTTSVTTIGTITPSAVVIKDSINNDITNNYTISYQSGTLAITGIAATCPTLTAYEGTYDGQNHTITVGNDAEGGTVQYRTSTTGSWSTTAPTRKDVGTTTVYVQVVGDENHNNADCGSSMIVISKKGLTASATAANKTYDGTIDATCTISLSGIIGNDNVTATATGLFVNKNVGTNKGVACSNITLGGTNKDNYSVGNSVNTTANITAREITIKAKNQTIAFGENLVETPNQVEISNGELATGDAISSITLTPSTTDVTTTGTITPSAATIKDNDGSGASMTDNYIVNYATGNLTIVTVAAECPSATSYSGVYDGVNHTITVGNNANGGTVEYRTSATGEWTATKPTRKDAGTTTVYIRVAGDNNYAPVECGSRDINITAKELTSAEIPDYTATWIVGTNVYTKSISTGVGSERVTITYTPYENAIGEYTYSTTAGSGKYTISQPDSNYIITGAGKLTLVKVDATCPTMSAYNGAYDAESHTITVGNDAVGGTVEYRTSATGEWSTTKPTRKEAGTTIVYVRVEGDDNHNTKDCGNKSLTIVARDITITANNQTITYGESIQEGLSQIEVTSGSLVNGENITEITLTPSTTEVTTSGTITPSAATIKDGINNDVTDNYNITYESGALTILSLEEYFEYDSSLVYDETNGILGNILVNTTKSGLLDILDSDAELAIIDKNDNNIANTDIIKTGYKLRLIRPRGIDTLTLSVRGDSTGDGKVNMNDVTAAYRHYRKKTIINDPARLMAADVVGAKDVNMNDITRIYRIFRGTAQ